jgi:hypothetical protein
MDPAQRALLLSLFAQWAQHAIPDEDPSPWWLSPRQITAIAATFDAPTRSSNDPTARLIALALFFLLLCANTRANSRIPRPVFRKP